VSVSGKVGAPWDRKRLGSFISIAPAKAEPRRDRALSFNEFVQRECALASPPARLGLRDSRSA
jgi:hypothetical protein